MKVGDKVSVNIGMHTVAQAEVKSVDTKENTATLIVPATLVVMGVRTELTDLPNTEPATETVITGVDVAQPEVNDETPVADEAAGVSPESAQPEEVVEVAQPEPVVEASEPVAEAPKDDTSNGSV